MKENMRREIRGAILMVLVYVFVIGTYIWYTHSKFYENPTSGYSYDAIEDNIYKLFEIRSKPKDTVPEKGELRWFSE